MANSHEHRVQPRDSESGIRKGLKGRHHPHWVQPGEYKGASITRSHNFVKTMSQNTRTYSNNEITITWKPDVCIHSKICWHGLRQVFDPVKRPWIMPDAADSATIMEQIDKCPSGALSYAKNNSAPSIDAAPIAATQTPVTNITCLPNGPLVVNGEIVVKKSDGTEEIKTGTVALCRCGASSNKPYCDGSHNVTGFKG